MSTATPSSEADDDALAEMLADALVELASRPGVIRLAALQMAELLPETGLDDVALAKALGCTRKTVFNTRRTALEKLALQPAARELALSYLRSNS